MDVLHWLPFVSTTVTILFAAVVFSRYFLRHRRPASCCGWIGLTQYALGTFAEAYLAAG